MARTWTREHAINLQTRRKAQRWTLDQLATRASLPVDIVQQLERADEMELEDEDVLRQLALALGVLPKQLCNSPLRPGRKLATEVPASVPSAPTVLHDSSGSTGRPGMWAVATVAVLLIAAAFLPRACELMSAPDRPKAALVPKPITPTPVAPAAEQVNPAADPADQGAESVQNADAGAISALIADLGTPIVGAASRQLAVALNQPRSQVEEALTLQAESPGTPAAERLVMILVLGADASAVRESMSTFLEAAIAANDGALPWPAGAIEAAIAMGGVEHAAGAGLAIEAYLDDAQQPGEARSALKAALDRSRRGRLNIPTGAVRETDLLADTAPASASLPVSGTDLLQVAAEAEADSAAVDGHADSLDRCTQALAQPPSEPGEVAEALRQACAAAEDGHASAVRQQLAAWLEQVPSEWISISGSAPDLWRMLGWALFPTEAPTWEQAFGVDEERWLILVVAKLLDGAEG